MIPTGTLALYAFPLQVEPFQPAFESAVEQGFLRVGYTDPMVKPIFDAVSDTKELDRVGGAIVELRSQILAEVDRLEPLLAVAKSVGVAHSNSGKTSALNGLAFKPDSVSEILQVRVGFKKGGGNSADY